MVSSYQFEAIAHGAVTGQRPARKCDGHGHLWPQQSRLEHFSSGECRDISWLCFVYNLHITNLYNLIFNSGLHIPHNLTTKASMNWLEHSSGGKKILLKVQNWGGNDHFIQCVYSYCYKVIHLKKWLLKILVQWVDLLFLSKCAEVWTVLSPPQPLPTPTNSATDTHCTEGSI